MATFETSQKILSSQVRCLLSSSIFNFSSLNCTRATAKIYSGSIQQPDHSNFFWNQFLDHDVDLKPANQLANQPKRREKEIERR